ncbi:MAG: hypothetical protein EU981_04115 [Candidatus Liberibacter ctenarytainae]|uniref:Uncharacterized protein n=1 Tax=Candidatus Liberibacter ctenarytainae TaxID=2020335 RepID=A0A937AM21_9HYPH|nr:hypothetical protein [Candidatus Liberibacter ctenarytainae]
MVTDGLRMLKPSKSQAPQKPSGPSDDFLIRAIELSQSYVLARGTAGLHSLQTTIITPVCAENAPSLQRL